MTRIFASHFVPEDEQRAAEIDAAFGHNEQHFEVVRVPGERPTFNDFFRVANGASSEGDIAVICNSDIAISRHMDLAESHLGPDDCWCLGRWNKMREGVWRVSPSMDSQDAWVFRVPIKPVAADFPQGAPGCDNALAHHLSEAGYKLDNPCHTIPCFHLHASDARNYSATKVPPPYLPVRPSRLTDAPEPTQLSPMSITYNRTVEQLPFKSILHVALITPESPQNALRDSLAGMAESYAEVDWRAVYYSGGRKRLLTEILGAIATHKPDLVFMQLQSHEPIGVDEAKQIKEAAGKAKVVSWSGDVRSPLPQHYLDNGKIWDVTCMSNMDDVWELRKAGVRAEYLQIGFENHIYRPPSIRDFSPDDGPIVFLGNNYNEMFPLSGHRRDMVDALRGTFGPRFRVFGSGWIGGNGVTRPEDEVTIYRNCAVAIVQNHFQRDAYHSDRMERALGSGACVLSHTLPNCFEFTEDKHYVSWDTIPELIEKTEQLLTNREQRVRLARAGAEEAHKNNTWAARMNELRKILATVP